MRTDRNNYHNFSAQREDFSRSYSAHRRPQKDKYNEIDAVMWLLVSAIAALAFLIFGL